MFTLSSVFWTTDIAYDTETIKHLEFGWPVAFSVQNQSQYDPPFPHEMTSFTPGLDSLMSQDFYLSLSINFMGIMAIWLILIHFLNRQGDTAPSKVNKVVTLAYRLGIFYLLIFYLLIPIGHAVLKEVYSGYGGKRMIPVDVEIETWHPEPVSKEGEDVRMVEQ